VVGLHGVKDKRREMGMHNFRELKIWQRSIDLAEAIYKIVADFPKEEKFGLISQI